jgi:hypothetical protein
MKKISALVALSLMATSSAYAQTCAQALPIASNQTYNSDTTGLTNWMTTFGPLVSPSNDNLYTFVAGAQPLGMITPTVSNYTFAMYLIPSCSDTGSEASPIRSSGTLGVGMDLSTGAVPITAGSTYFVAVTGAAAGGAGANGTLTFTTGTLPVTLQGFEVD